MPMQDVKKTDMKSETNVKRVRRRNRWLPLYIAVVLVLTAWRKGFEDESTIAMIQGKDLGRGIPKSPTAVVPEPVVEEAKPLTKLEQYKLRLEEKEKAKAAKAEVKEGSDK